MSNARAHQRFRGNQSQPSGFLSMSGTSPFLQTKRGRHFHGSGITVNKKAQTAESSNAGVSLPIDGAYPLNPDGSLAVEAREVPAADAADELWYKDAIIYQLHVKAFADSNNDGIGDFAGLTEKLGYLQDLGVTTLWLLPFYPSPGRDDGYDIADYGDINPDFGTMKDFRRFIQEAKKRGLRVITELVINHTSDQHDWFKRARRCGSEFQLPATGMSGAIPTRNTRARGSSSPIPRNRTGPGIRKPASSTGTASSRTSRTSISTIRAW